MKKTKKLIKVVMLILGISYVGYMAPRSLVWSAIKTKAFDYTENWDVQEGDFVFQHITGELLRVIADVTKSPYSHCGIVVKRKGGYYVLEAIGPVKLTPLNEWIHRGIKSRITVVRLKQQYRQDILQIIAAAYKYFDRPYDVQYEWDDEKIYCSELIYKAVRDGADIKLARFRMLGEMNWQPHVDFIKEIAGGDLPLKRKMITPVDLVRSDKVTMVYSDFNEEIK